MAQKRPHDRPGFLAVDGVGETKATLYAERFLAAIRDFASADP